MSDDVSCAETYDIRDHPNTQDLEETREVRAEAARDQTEAPQDWDTPNDRRSASEYRSYREGSFTKLLEHDPDTGLLTASAVDDFDRLVDAIHENDAEKLERIERPEGERRWISPRSSSAGTLKGQHPSIPSDSRFSANFEAPPSLESPEAIVEMCEAYLFAVCRDVEFDDYGSGRRSDSADGFEEISHDSVTRWASDMLQGVLARLVDTTDHSNVEEAADALEIPTDEEGDVTPSTLFRGYARFDGDEPHSLTGPYHSQFLLQQLYPLFPSGCAPYVAGLTGVTELDLDAIAEERFVPIANRREFGVTWDNFVAIQNGAIPESYREDDFESNAGRMPFKGRDMGTHVHTDGPYQEYYRSANVLVFWDFPRTKVSPYSPSENEADGVTFGPVDIFSIVGAVAYEAFKAAWVQKWRAFQRLRPEAMAGLIELRNDPSRRQPSDVSELDALIDTEPASDILEVVEEYNRRQSTYAFAEEGTTGTYLLGQMYPEGSPAHPAYPSGHATVAGACITVLKALFCDEAPITCTGMRPVAIDPDDPTEHVFIDRGTHAHPDVGKMTVGSELDKLGSNIAHARMFGGVHYRSDGEKGLRLGEQVALRYLQGHLRMYPEAEYPGFYELTTRDGDRVRVKENAIQTVDAQRRSPSPGSTAVESGGDGRAGTEGAAA